MIDSTDFVETGARQIRIHATNIVGIGAVQLVQSLLPAMERIGGYELKALYLPSRGALSAYRTRHGSTAVVARKRCLPNVVSRVIECTFHARRFEGDGALLVLGDIPLRCRGPQTVLVQTTMLTNGARSSHTVGALKYWIARTLFRINARFASAYIVQTQAMKRALADTYPEIAARIHVIGLPAPAWLLAAKLQRTGVVDDGVRGLRLFFPAAPYPHKNHRLLSRIESSETHAWRVAALTLTIGQSFHPNPGLDWIQCVGQLSPQDVIAMYGRVDALLFLSLSESLGFPLVEAMWVGLPIICPDLPYAHAVCGADAIYFDPENIESLRLAIVTLEDRLRAGWWPNWSEALQSVPENWERVASAMLRLTADQDEHNGAN